MRERLKGLWLDYIARRGGINVIWDLWTVSVATALAVGFIAGHFVR